MDAVSCFEEWRANNSADQSWGLAWFLANEICKRYYASHGIVPWVIEHEGLGYYGITLNQLECKINKNESKELGRFTMSGNVENWATGSPVDHKLNTIKMCDDGVGTGTLIAESIRHFCLSPYPEKSHQYCRHKRWGDSYKLCFEIATIVALKYEGQVQIANHPFHTARNLESSDSKFGISEHPGAFIFSGPKGTLSITGDGRLLGPIGENLWEKFMVGETVESLVDFIAESVGARIRPTLYDVTQLVSYLPKLYPDESIDYGSMPSTEQNADGSYSFPHYTYSRLVKEFFEIISAECWIDPDYDPIDTGRKLAEEGNIENANVESLVTLLTYCERGEKFCDGHWNAMLKEGYIKRILHRLASLYEIRS